MVTWGRPCGTTVPPANRAVWVSLARLDRASSNRTRAVISRTSESVKNACTCSRDMPENRSITEVTHAPGEGETA